MADQRNGGIVWTDHTWNVLRGCSKVSAGCTNCYAEGVAARFSGPGLPFEGLVNGRHWNGKVMLVEDKLTEPLRWTRPRMVFVTSVSDPFHQSVTDETLDRIFAVMALAPRHTFQVLTKRPERMREYLNDKATAIRVCKETVALATTDALRFGNPAGTDGWWPLPNVWLGVSVEDQAAADERIPPLLETPAAVRFLSCEPLLGPVDIAWALSRNMMDIASGFQRRGHFSPGLETLRPLHWVIVGGESGPKARPMRLDWARGLRDQCAAAGVPFMLKQWGEWTPAELVHELDGRRFREMEEYVEPIDGMYRVGKKAAGRLLDGVEHNGYPEVRRG